MARVVAVVQARMGSTRLSGKTMGDLAGKPVLQHVVERLSRAHRIDEVVVATTTSPNDEPILELAKQLGVPAFRGSEEDVLSRYLLAARESRADVVVRVTGDCPLIDPDLSDDVVEAYFLENADYASNWLVRKFPRGADTEAFSTESLVLVDKKAKEPYEREHATPYYYYHPEEFRLASVEATGELRRPDLRLCVDTDEDFRLMNEVFDRLGGGGNDFSMLEVVRLLDRAPELAAINAHVKQKKTR